ncbi:MAG: hypothetical protein GKR94_06770 [Gammaproteobacteria bacterium]|nr:hypothetical protein [Gammaproteobacteria bacterium]
MNTEEFMTELKSGQYPPYKAMAMARERGTACVRDLAAIAGDEKQKEVIRFWALSCIHWAGDDSDGTGVTTAVRLLNANAQSVRVAALEVLQTLNPAIAEQMAQQVLSDGSERNNSSGDIHDTARRILNGKPSEKR